MDNSTLMLLNGILITQLRLIQPGLRERIAALEDRNSVGPMDELDLITERCEKEFHLMMRQHNSRTAREILAALQRLKSGKYGVCEECGTRIGLERLKAQPAASVCIECKKELEAEERRLSQAS